MSDFEIVRLRRIFTDVMRTTQGQAAMLALTPNAPGTPLIQGIANRAGLIRLGVGLARSACQADAIVSIHQNGFAATGGDPALIEIALTDDPLLPPIERHRFSGTALVFAKGGVLALAIVGLVTVLQWIVR